MSHASIEQIGEAIRDVPDFPKPGIIFKDITPVLASPDLLKLAINLFVERCREVNAERILGIDARGFIFGAPAAYALGIGFAPVRKKGKLPFSCAEASYALEYGEATIQLHTDAVRPGERVVIIDDLLATGGTAAAAIELVQRQGGDVVDVQFLIELEFLKGREKLGDTPVTSFLKFA